VHYFLLRKSFIFNEAEYQLWMRGVGVSFEYFLWHFLYQIFEDGYQIFLELTVGLFCLADFKRDFMWQLRDVEQSIISFE
jgi:hypothetical protein